MEFSVLGAARLFLEVTFADVDVRRKGEEKSGLWLLVAGGDVGDAVESFREPVEFLFSRGTFGFVREAEAEVEVEVEVEVATEGDGLSSQN